MNLQEHQTLTRMCLQKEKNATFKFGCGSHNYNTYHKEKEYILYLPNSKNVKVVTDKQIKNAYYIELVTETVEKASSTSSIKLVKQWDAQTRKSKMVVVSALDEGFYSLPKTMKILVKGHFNVGQLDDSRFLIFDQDSYEFTAEIIPGLRSNEIMDFTGASTMERVVNTNRFPAYFKMRYSVELVWHSSTAKNASQVVDGLTDKSIVSEINKLNNSQRLYNDKRFVDFKIVASNRAEIPCHRNILALHGDLIKILESGTSVEMKEMSEKSVTLFLKFLYEVDTFEKEFDGDNLLEILKTAHNYNIVALEDKMVNFIISKSDGWFDMKYVLMTYVFTSKIIKFQNINTKMLLIMKRNPEKLEQSPTFKAMLKQYPAQTAELAMALLKVKESGSGQNNCTASN